MKLDALRTYDVPADVIDTWKERVGDELLPIQVSAVNGGLFLGRNLVIVSSTSTGKTFIGEMGATHVARQDRKSMLIVPLKSVAEEKFRDLRERYARHELEVVISTRDRREYDGAIERGEYRLAIIVYEKLQSLLVSHPGLLDEVGLVVIDELQTLCEPKRGQRLEILLTKLRRSPAQLIGLSAVLGNPQPLADWLGAELIVSQKRPVDLKKGVCRYGQNIYLDHNTGLLGEEQLFQCEEPAKTNPRLAHREHIILSVGELARDEALLMFVPDRPTCCAYATMLAQKLAFPAATEAIAELELAEESNARSTLLATLPRGIAFHNSDLTLEERDIVERGFRNGSVRVIVATSTLAVGVNLPVKTVVIPERWKWGGPRKYPDQIDLTPSDFENMGGRAGRLGLAEGFGRAILLAESKWNQGAWMRHLIQGPLDEVQPTLRDRPLCDVVLDLVASRLCDTDEAISTFLLESFTGRVHWTPVCGKSAFGVLVAGAIEQLLQYELVHRDPHGHLQIGRVGRVAAVRGLCADSAFSQASWALKSRSTPVTAFETLVVTSFLPDAEHVFVRLRYRQQSFFIADALELIRRLHITHRPPFSWILENPGRLTEDEVKGIKRAMILHEWIGEKKRDAIEKTHFVSAGTIQQLASEFSWLLECQAEIAETLEWSRERVATLRELAERLRSGVRADLVPLSRLGLPGLGRTHLRRLAEAGILTEEQLRAADADQLAAALRHGGLARKVRAALTAREAVPALRLVPVLAPVVYEPIDERPTFSQRAADAPTTCTVGLPGAILAPESATLPVEPALDQGSATPASSPPAVEPPTAPDTSGDLSAPEISPSPLVLPRKLKLTAFWHFRRCRIELDDRALSISTNAFVILLLLALARLKGEGWLHKLKLGASRRVAGWTGMYRLRQQLLEAGGEVAMRLIELDGRGLYRLVLLAEQIELDLELLATHKAPAVQQLLASLRKEARP